MKHSLLTTLLTATMIFAASPAMANSSAVTILGVTGKVMVNLGNGFEPALPDTVINQGTEVFVAENSSAIVRFNAGNCNVLLAAGSVTRITDASMCQQASLSSPLPQGMRGLIDDVVVTPVNGYAPPPPPPVAPGFISPYFIAGGFLAVGTATVAFSVLQHDQPAPVPTSAL
jgi:hypothetical protein